MRVGCAGAVAGGRWAVACARREDPSAAGFPVEGRPVGPTGAGGVWVKPWIWRWLLGRCGTGVIGYACPLDSAWAVIARDEGVEGVEGIGRPPSMRFGVSDLAAAASAAPVSKDAEGLNSLWRPAIVKVHGHYDMNECRT